MGSLRRSKHFPQVNEVLTRQLGPGDLDLGQLGPRDLAPVPSGSVPGIESRC